MKRGVTKEEIIHATQELIARNGIRAVLDTRAALGPPASSGCEKGCERFAASSHNRSFSQ